MTTIYNNNGFKIEKAGNSYYVSNAFDCIFRASSERKAVNFLKRALEDEGKQY
jgi:hypothetical protein